jgi:hypothetical protein
MTLFLAIYANCDWNDPRPSNQGGRAAAERDAEEVGRRNFMRMMRHFSTYFTRNAAQGG